MITHPAKYRRARHGDRVAWILWCPACRDTHVITDLWAVTEHDDGTLTAEPSILVTQPPTDYRCHSYLRAGVWQYLDDCSHEHAGHTLPMADIPGYFSA